MASFELELGAGAEGELRETPFPFRRQLWQRILRLRDDPAPPHSREIDEEGRRSLELHGYRLLYRLDEGARLVTVLAIRRA